MVGRHVHTVPLAAVYLLWFSLTRPPVVIRVDGRSFTLHEYLKWLRDAGVGLFDGLGHFTAVGILLAILLIAGTVVAVRTEGAGGWLRRAAVPAALLVAAVLAMSLAAPSRFALGEGGAKAGRYVGVMAAMTLPALAVAADAISRRWRWTTPLVAAVFLLPLPFNIAVFGSNPVLSRAGFNSTRNFVTNLPDNPLIGEVPPWVRPNESLLGTPGMTVGWLLEASRNGELPAPTEPMNPLLAPLVPIELGVARVDGGAAYGMECTDHTAPLAVDPHLGERWYVDGDVQIQRRVGDKPNTLGVLFSRTGLEITLPDLHLLLTPASGESTFRLCR